MNTAILQTLSIITFAFTAHAQLLSVANEVKDYTQTKMDFICACAIGLCGVLYSSVGYMGYMTFGDNVDDNLLESYPSDVVVTIARVGISALVRQTTPSPAPLDITLHSHLLASGIHASVHPCLVGPWCSPLA